MYCTLLSSARRPATVLLVALILFAGCDQAALSPPEAPRAGDKFATYVAIGNSITAGYQSAGINKDTQLESYAVKVAEKMGTEFNSPLLADPGCPPPPANPLTGSRTGQGTERTCSLRERPFPSVLHNVAVPGAAVIDVLNNLDEDANANELTFLLLGGRTQMEAVADADPTFVSVWIGDNDVLSPALSGDATRVTPLATFRERYTALLDSLDQIGVENGVLIAVGDVTLAPTFSLGLAYWQVEQGGQYPLPPSFDVADNCAPSQPGDSTLVPFEYGFGLIRDAQAEENVTLDCVNDPEVLTQSEAQMIRATVEGYNSFIEQQARARGWAFVDVNPIIRALRESGAIPALPDVSDPDQAFGEYFSLDGVHPSGLAHKVVANEVIEAINDTYDTDIERVSEVPDLP